MSGRLKQRQVAILSMLLFYLSVMPAHAAIITVTNTNDNGPGSLRQALTTANDGDTINFAVTGTITLSSGALPINKNITISGPGADHLSIDGSQAITVFGVFYGNIATISGLTATNAQSGIFNEGTVVVTNCVLSGNLYFGVYSYNGVTNVSDCVITGNALGGLFNNGSFGPNNSVAGLHPMTVSDSTISNNSGPGVWNYFFLTILNSTLSDNSAGDALGGGGIRSGTFKAPGSVTVINSTISGNSALGGGGGMAIYYGGLIVVNSTISGNSATYDGGGISGSGGVQVTNSTISGNSATDPDYGSGGGISANSLRIVNSTVAGNSAATCGGVCGETVEIGNTILNANTSGNIDGTVTSDGYNISSDNGGGHLNGPGDQTNTDPLLGALQDNGGLTLTHLLLPGSPAIDAGDPNFTPPPSHDQRGSCFHRKFGRRIDVGSVETQPRPRCVTPAPRPTP